MELIEMTTEDKLFEAIDAERLPAHVAIIMDGNGRWAKERGLPRSAGHRQGVETLREVVRYASSLGIGVLTMFAFSTENWRRPPWEVKYLMGLPQEYLYSELPELIKNNVRVNLLGDPRRLPGPARQAVEKGIEETAHCSGMLLNFALNYGSRQEIIRAVRTIGEDLANGKLTSAIDEEVFASYLYTAGAPDPDLLIRTGGEYRLSNFLLWQIAYSELWFTKTYWPDFKCRHLLQALGDYQRRERRFGQV
ncbi:MAG: isoprenyl transferase [Firmicutes bacterium]|nr:isoprenyl transferase [Bacillota bacterium]